MIHRFWDGAAMPDRYKEYKWQWALLNPEFIVNDWDLTQFMEKVNNSLSKYVLLDLKKRDNGRGTEEYYVQIADLIGYELIYAFGGQYFNCDIEPVRPLSYVGIDNASGAWASYENDTDGRIVNAAIGGPPRYAFWGSVIQEAVRRYWDMPDAEMVMTTGPGMLTDVVHIWNRDHQGGVDRVRVLPTETFNPVHWKQIEAGGTAEGKLSELPTGTVGIHHWGHKLTGRSNRIPS